MNRTQKIIVVLSLVLILAAFLFPPYFVIIENRVGIFNTKTTVDSGWGWVFGFKSMRVTTIQGNRDAFQVIRYDVLTMEILAAVTLGGIGFFIFRKHKKLEDEK